MKEKETKRLEKCARYVVTTHWGTFSLDEASYRDYLDGKLWISWTPGGRKATCHSPADGIPPNVTDRAVALRDLADRVGICAALQELNVCSASAPFVPRLAELSVDELSLTVRSSNGLKRADIHTFGQLNARLSIEGGIQSVRNLGVKSSREIQDVFYDECYLRLLPYEKALYWQKVLDTNRGM